MSVSRSLGATGVDGPIQAPGLLGRHVGKRSGDEFRGFGQLTLAGKPGRDTEARKPHATKVINNRVGGLDVLMDEALAVGLAKCYRETNGGANEAS